MLEAVITFAALSALFEFIIVAKLPPAARWWAVRHPGAVHLATISFNLWVHFGTITGTMTAITAGLASFGTMAIARLIWRNPLIA